MPTSRITINNRPIALDARPDRLDLRDRTYSPRLGCLPECHPTDERIAQWLPRYTQGGLVLDQGAEGACTGFGLAAIVNYLLFIRQDAPAAKARRVSPAMFYKLARLYDEWPGEDYDGSSCRGALKGWQKHGVCAEELWPSRPGARRPAGPVEDPARRDDPMRNWDLDALRTTLGVYFRVDIRSVVDMQAAIVETGGLYVSATVHEGWDLEPGPAPTCHADLKVIRAVAKPKQPGGHAFALVGYNDCGFIVQNSWGRRWGSGGFALLPYEDWVNHGTDAWVLTLGVPRPRMIGTSGQMARAPRFLVPVTGTGGGSRPARLVAFGGDLDARYRGVPKAYAPIDGDTAYGHAIVMDRGFPLGNDITREDPLASLRDIAYTRPLAWMKSARGNRKLMVYVHGGLNSEDASIERARVLAPYALRNDVYPLFVVWRSGALETLGDMVQEAFTRTGVESHPSASWLDRITEATDAMLEPLLRTPGGAMWGQMKTNAVRASASSAGALRHVVDAFAALRREDPKLEIHLVGHSAGAIVIGAMLDRLRAARLKVASLRLFAPACTVRFALDHYRPAVRGGTLDARHWHVHNLSDANELRDSVGPYRKSLLYLVSRSFEDVKKMPILGLDSVFDPALDGRDDRWSPDEAAAVREFRRFWEGLRHDETNRHVLSGASVSNGVRSVAASHGCFDNAVDIVGHAIGAIAGRTVKVHRLDY